MRAISDFWTGATASPVTDEIVRAWESRLGVKLPSAFLELYRIHNGGSCCGGYPFELLPLDDAPRGESVCSLEELAADGAYLDEDGLDSLVEAIGDPRKIVAMAFDGAACSLGNLDGRISMTISTEQFDSHIGTWCQLADVSGLGVIATDEFQFLSDGTFVWFSFAVDGKREFLIRRAGTWKQTGELLALQINQSSEPDIVPKERVDLKIFDREGQLGLEKCRQDEESRKNICSYFLKPATAGIALQRLQAAQEKALAKRKLPAPFAPLESKLVDAIPAEIQKLKLKKPIFCLRLYYFDTHAPAENYGFRIRVLTEALRKRLQDKCPHVPDLVEDLWLPQTGAANGIANPKDGLYEATFQGNKEITRLFGEIYQRLCQSESENMPLLRQLARRVCQKLNAMTWGSDAPITDDFVAFPADGSGFWGDEFEEDLIASVPAARLKVLRKRGFLE